MESLCEHVIYNCVLLYPRKNETREYRCFYHNLITTIQSLMNDTYLESLEPCKAVLHMYGLVVLRLSGLLRHQSSQSWSHIRLMLVLKVKVELYPAGNHMHGLVVLRLSGVLWQQSSHFWSRFDLMLVLDVNRNDIRITLNIIKCHVANKHRK